MKERYRLSVEVSADDLEALRAAAAGAGCAHASEFVASLLAHVVDGVRRPGAWERAWLRKVSWDLELVTQADPDCRWRSQPKALVAVTVDPGIVRVDVGTGENDG